MSHRRSVDPQQILDAFRSRIAEMPAAECAACLTCAYALRTAIRAAELNYPGAGTIAIGLVMNELLAHAQETAEGSVNLITLN